MAKKIYAVRKGINPGIYFTWDECKSNVNGYPGAEYKSFQSEHEAKEYLGILEKKDIEDKTKECNAKVIAYVDGSYNELKKQYAYGVVIFYDGKEEHFSEKFSDESLVEMRNVAGEIAGAKRAIKYCLDKHIDSIDIYYDYEGIEKWCTGEWRARKEGTKAYKKYYDNASKFVNIRFIKVKGHSGNQYNDLADELAKRALGLSDTSNVLKCNCKGIVANNIRFDDYKSILELLGEDFNNLKLEEKEIPYGIQYKLSLIHI